MGVRNKNSSNYVHPDEPNLLNLHKSMELVDGIPHVRVTLGSDNITITGDVNLVEKVKLWDGTDNLVFDMPNNDGETAPISLPTENHNMVFNGSTWDRMRGNKDDGILAKITNFPAFPTEIDVGNFPAFPTSITANQGTAGATSWKVDIGTNGTVTINQPVAVTQHANSTPWQISKNTSVNSSTNPIYVSNEGSTVVVGNLPEVSVTAFEEPLAVGITPLIQATSIYGLDPDFWVTTELNGGAVSTTTSSTWQVSSGTTAGGYARLATNKYMTYQPGQGSMFRWTAAFTTTDAASTNPYPTKNSLGIDSIVQNTGPIDRTDGYSFGYSGSTADNASRKIGILHRRGGGAETRALTITRAPTGAQTAVVTLNGIQYNIAITASTSVAYTAEQLAKGLNAITEANNMWDIEACGGIITFTYYSPGAKTGTFSFSASGTGTVALGTFSQIVAGVTPIDTWTYVADWDNQSIQFDPTKLNVFGVDLRWLGAGRVRFFMEDPSTGKMVLVHTQRWSSQYLVPHVYKPSLRLIYRSGTTNAAITPSQNVVVTGASVFAAVQGMVNQTGGSQAYYNIDSTTRAKDTVWHLMSIQNPYVRNNAINKASINLQDLTVAVQANDPSVIYIVKNAIGTSDFLVYNPIPNTTTSMFCQYSISAVTENLALDRVTNIQTVGINGSAQFDLMKYNLTLSPGETVSVFINSSNAISRSSVGVTWHVD